MLSAILYLGNVTYKPKENGECLKVGPDHVLSALSDLLKVTVNTSVVVYNQMTFDPYNIFKHFYFKYNCK